MILWVHTTGGTKLMFYGTDVTVHWARSQITATIMHGLVFQRAYLIMHASRPLLSV